MALGAFAGGLASSVAQLPQLMQQKRLAEQRMAFNDRRMNLLESQFAHQQKQFELEGRAAEGADLMRRQQMLAPRIKYAIGTGNVGMLNELHAADPEAVGGIFNAGGLGEGRSLSGFDLRQAEGGEPTWVRMIRNENTMRDGQAIGPSVGPETYPPTADRNAQVMGMPQSSALEMAGLSPQDTQALLGTYLPTPEARWSSAGGGNIYDKHTGEMRSVEEPFRNPVKSSHVVGDRVVSVREDGTQESTDYADAYEDTAELLRELYPQRDMGSPEEDAKIGLATTTAMLMSAEYGVGMQAAAVLARTALDDPGDELVQRLMAGTTTRGGVLSEKETDRREDALREFIIKRVMPMMEVEQASEQGPGALSDLLTSDVGAVSSGRGGLSSVAQ